MKVNLSRIHNILQQLTAEVRAKYAQAMRPLQAGDFSFKILEGTTDADLDEFMGKLKKKKHETEKLFADTRRITAPICVANWTRRTGKAASPKSSWK